MYNMFKINIIITFLFAISITDLYSQIELDTDSDSAAHSTGVDTDSGIDNSSDNDNETETEVEEIIDPDAAGTSMDSNNILADVPIDDIIEAVGVIKVSGVNFRDEPNERSRVVRKSLQGERVIILGETKDWFLVRMYNNRDAYIFKKYVKTDRIYTNERGTEKTVNKKVFIEIDDLVDEFNVVVRKSKYAKTNRIIPYLEILDSKKVKEKIIITFLYSANNLDGKIVPSLKSNGIQDETIYFLEHLIGKLMLSDVSEIEVIIKTPIFNKTGVFMRGRMTTYSTLYIDVTKVDLRDIKKDDRFLWKYIKSTHSKTDLFKSYPH